MTGESIIIDFEKEYEIQKVGQILRTWPSERVSFLRESLENLPQIRKTEKAGEI
jgi:hypothetical protein